MSGPPPGPGAPGSRSVSVNNGPPSAGMAPQQPMPPQQATTPAAAAAQSQSQQNLNQIVLEYLNKKGYNRTEAMLRKESSQLDSNRAPVDESGFAKFQRSYELLRTWIDGNIDLYQPELRKLLWPIFVYSFLQLAADFYQDDSKKYFALYKDSFMRDHPDDVRQLEAIRNPEHVSENQTAKLYRNNKYRLSLTNMAFSSLLQFLESKEREGGSVLLMILQNHMNIVTFERSAAGPERTIQAIRFGTGHDDDLPGEDEGIPGHAPGSANTGRESTILAKLQLAQMPMEPELQEDVRAQLEEEDARNPPKPGQNSLVDEFEQRIKTEPEDDVPNRDLVPLPPSVARDVNMEVQKVIEHRDRFRISGRTGGVGPGISVTMFTFHNTFDNVNCMDFSGDNTLVAVGTAESYIRVWSMDGTALPDTPGVNNSTPSSSKRLYGHSGPVYAVSFSPSTASPDPAGPSTSSRYLLSSSADKSIRLWSLETWSNVVVYKSHDAPVWDVKWGPYGHYFLTGSADWTARLWSTDHVEPHKIYVGHDNDVDCVAFHPNNLYVFTASCDKTVRMWHISSGSCLRLFTGHTSAITAIACSPDGKVLATADDTGSIILWDLAKGRRKKRMRGHAKGGIWSLSWSVESTVLVSGGADGTVRVWDAVQETIDGKIVAEGGAGTKIDGAAGAAGTTAGKKTKTPKETVVSADQISAFPTKKSPVYHVQFTRMNLVLAGGAYMP
ncbi:WD40 repeat-like protein [Pseudovirgaria hyperparasitica]|uniref:WD40 repeat-like protein n=1 Tax=Pseudovirgaria hyperparasitica TaxID=470096 RepID=A0A6A6WFA3_9PEZI|nr:WD40 repeat-like protein [Pseudovirgaria hyperparasitica]KAF2760839.1 WD40 repeat-like protein [Pseudovirgaria hyperparasitica]